MEVSSSAMQPLWQAAFGDAPRPELYSDGAPDEDGFVPLNDPTKFINDLNTMSSQQLYASAANNQLALKLAQDEYLLIGKLIVELRGKDKDSSKDPQALQRPDVFEDMKESQLYGYKYEKERPSLLNQHPDAEISEMEKRDVRFFQEPFEQGGFIPTDRQYKSIMAKAKDPRNPDGWEPIVQNGQRLIPRRQIHHDEYIRHARMNRHEDPEHTVARPGTASSLDSAATPSKPTNKRLTRTRFDGQKVPPTRDVSEAPSIASTPRGRRQNTPKQNGSLFIKSPAPEESPVPKRRKLNTGSQSQNGRPQIKLQNGHMSHSSSIKTISNGPATIPAFMKVPISVEALRHRKWTTEDLVEAVRYDHLWLTDNSKQSEHWRDKILASQFPVRTYSMFKKWAYWKDNNRDKRPRPLDGRGKQNGKKSFKVESEKRSNRRSAKVNGQETGQAETILHNGGSYEDRTNQEGWFGLEDGIASDDESTEDEEEMNVGGAMTRDLAEEFTPSVEETIEVATSARRSLRRSKRTSG